MALGGYKFAGYKCTKGSSMTDTEWSLLIHKTRIKAFLDANTSANAGWVFDLNGGTIDFDSTYVGVIYDLGGDGLNLVSYFRNGTAPNAKYYMIASLFNWTCGSPTSPQIQISNTGPIVYGYYSSSGQYKVNNHTLFHTVSYEPFPEDCILNSANNYPQKALPMIPVYGFGSYTNATPSSNLNDNSTLFKSAKLYFGYALKNLDIISFTTFNDKMAVSDSRVWLKTTFVGFDSLALSSPDDSANIYGICLTNNSNVYEIASSGWGNYDALYRWQETLTDSFIRYESYNSPNDLFFGICKKACFNGTTQTYPFETVTLTTGGCRNSAPFLNADGITSKGTFDIELLSSNGSYNYNIFTMWKPVANGNYLPVAIKTLSNSGYTDQQTTYYVGWDASNPNILDESSWTEFAG